MESGIGPSFQYVEVEQRHRAVVSLDPRLLALRHLFTLSPHFAFRLSGSSHLFVYRHHRRSVGTYLECVVRLSHGDDDDYA